MAYKPKTTKERIVHRLKIVQGHVRKVQSMVDTDEYCIDIIHQSQAIQKALKEIDNVILQDHLLGCVTRAIQKGQKDTAVKEVMSIFKKTK